MNPLITLTAGSLIEAKWPQALASLRAAGATVLSFSLKIQPSRKSVSETAETEDIRQSQDGDSDAFGRVVERHQRHVSQVLWRFSRDRTVHEELVQETFVQAYLSLKGYRASAPFEHWLTRIATRVGYRYWKESKKQEHFSLLDSDWDRIADDSQNGPDPETAGRIVYQMLSQLPPRCRLVLTLRYLEQCDVEETARRTGWSSSMVKVQTFRAKQKLKQLLKHPDMEIELEL